jgi:membrane-associated phospholipid phosphatase
MVFRRPNRATWAGASLLALAAIAAALVPAGPLGIDRSWSEAMQDIRTRPLTDIALALDWLGRFPGSLVAIGVVGAVLLVAHRQLALLVFVVAECLAPLVTAVLKSLGGRPRPHGGLVHAGGFSFPSGHAAYAGVTCAAAVLLLAATGSRRRRWWALAAAGIAGMAWSRTYLQVHWLSDVLGGATVGVGVALLVVAAAPKGGG